MAGRYEQAELLVALWKLGGDESPMPTSHGILDRALDASKDDLPSELGELSFSNTGVGLRCFELPGILLAAQEALLTSEPNPTYHSTLVRLDQDDAAEIAMTYGLDIGAARAIGRTLVDAAETFVPDVETEVAAA